jgi:t-SNARE complex subunit (syntaxin)
VTGRSAQKFLKSKPEEGEEMDNIIIGIVSGLVSSGLVGMLGVYSLNRVSRLERDIKELETKRLEKLETRFESMINRISDKLDRLVDETAEQRAQIKDQRNFLNNTYQSLQGLRKELARHGK